MTGFERQAQTLLAALQRFLGSLVLGELLLESRQGFVCRGLRNLGKDRHRARDRAELVAEWNAGDAQSQQLVVVRA